MIDVVVLTKNSVKPCLSGCLESIAGGIPDSRLIAVDGGSTDGTIDLLEAYGAAVIDDSNGNRATARQKGIEAVKSDWFVFVDSDVILCENWLEKAMKHASSDVGAVWGAAIPASPSSEARYKAMGKFYGLSMSELAVRAGRMRGLTHDTLIRTEAVRDIQIPKDLTVLEDHYVRKHVEGSGFRWLSVTDPYCIHLEHERDRPRDYEEYGRCGRKTGFLPSWKVASYAFLGIPKALWILAATGSWSASKTQLSVYYHVIKGYLL